MTKIEKHIVSLMFIISIIGEAVLCFRVKSAYIKSDLMLERIQKIGESTDKTPLIKGVYFDKEENKDKLNLNRTDLRSIKDIPGMSASLAKSIYKYIQNKDEKQIKDLNELLSIKGFSKEKLMEFEPYITVTGGHAGYKAWGDKLNLNFARKEDLSSLPGISPKIAQDIILYRNSNGNFTYIEELLEVKSVKKGTFYKIKDLVCVQ